MSQLSKDSLALAFSLLALTAANANAAPARTAPGGLYVGYYQEDPLANPEDPMPGAFVLKLPYANATFDGAMFFTFVGCQTSNVGAVKGVKAGLDLKGEWSGKIDNSEQSGSYAGAYDPRTASYKGVYANRNGKQFKDIKGCIQYWIGPKGSWEMFPVEQSQPAGFKVGVSGSTVSWDKVPGAAMALVYLIDRAAALAGGGNPVKFQTVLPGPTASFKLSAAGLSKGKEYLAVTLVSNARTQRLAFGSKRFVAP